MFHMPEWLQMDGGASQRLLVMLNIYKVAKGVICYTSYPHAATQVLFLC